MGPILAKALERVARIFPIENFKALEVSTNYTQNIYAKNSVFYTLLHSYGGSLHMALTEPTKTKKRVHHYQLEKIAKTLSEQRRYNPKPFKVMELGCGKGYNLLYLAKKFPKIRFIGIDITATYVKEAKKKVKSLPNVEIFEMDMDDISFDANSFRLIYDIESACHSHQHEKLLGKSYQLLERKGQFMLFELFRNKHLKNQSPEEQNLLRYIELSVAIYQGIRYQDWMNLAKSKGFQLIKNQNLSDKTIYGLTRFHRIAALYFRFPFLAKTVNPIIPKELQMYAVAAYLFKYSLENELQVYFEITLEKKSFKTMLP